MYINVIENIIKRRYNCLVKKNIQIYRDFKSQNGEFKVYNRTKST